MPKVLLFGATGGCGLNALKICLSKEYKVYALCRNVNSAKNELSKSKIQDLDKVTFLEGSLFDKEPKYVEIINEIDYIIHCAAYRPGSGSSVTEEQVALQGMKTLVKHAKNVKKIIYVTSMFVTRPNTFVALFLNTLAKMTLKWKLEAENVLRESGIPYVIIRPGRLTDKEITDKGVQFYQGDKDVGHLTSRVDVGRACIESIERDVQNTTFEMTNTYSSGNTDWGKQFSSLHKDQEKTIIRNHHLPFYMIYTALGLFTVLIVYWKYLSK